VLGQTVQIRAAATGKARSPTVDSRVRRTFNVNDDEERRRLRVPKSALCSSLSARYDGAVYLVTTTSAPVEPSALITRLLHVATGLVTNTFRNYFLSRDARAERGDATVSRLSVCLSVRL